MCGLSFQAVSPFEGVDNLETLMFFAGVAPTLSLLKSILSLRAL
jgi:hypothetical protein